MGVDSFFLIPVESEENCSVASVIKRITISIFEKAVFKRFREKRAEMMRGKSSQPHLEINLVSNMKKNPFKHRITLWEKT